MAIRFILMLGLLLMAAIPARSAPLDLPGLQKDTQTYVAGLTKRFPAGGTQAGRKTAEQQAAAAIAKQDWAAAAVALESRVAQGETTAKQFLDLANAQMRRTPPDPRAAMYAAAAASIAGTPAGEAEIPGLLLLAETLKA